MSSNQDHFNPVMLEIGNYGCLLSGRYDRSRDRIQSTAGAVCRMFDVKYDFSLYGSSCIDFCILHNVPEQNVVQNTLNMT